MGTSLFSLKNNRPPADSAKSSFKSDSSKQTLKKQLLYAYVRGWETKMFLRTDPPALKTGGPQRTLLTVGLLQGSTGPSWLEIPQT